MPGEVFQPCALQPGCSAGKELPSDKLPFRQGEPFRGLSLLVPPGHAGLPPPQDSLLSSHNGSSMSSWLRSLSQNRRWLC